jgi:RecG-like helicase
MHRLRQSDEERLAEELQEWAGTIEGSVRIADVPLRRRAKVVGMVRRITVRPVQGFQALEVVLYDGTGELSARWLGRRLIPGLALGSRLVVEGVTGQEHGTLRMVNPTFEFA